jgi:predicted aspartyl protease
VRASIGQSVPVSDPRRIARAEVRLDFSGPDPMVWVPTTINGQGPFEFLLDTGSSINGVRTSVANQVGLELSEELREGYSYAGGSFMHWWAQIDSLAVLDAEVLNTEAIVHDWDYVNKIFDNRVDGVIGYAFLRHFTMTIDYPRQLLQLE